jgi:hypothetical protein
MVAGNQDARDPLEAHQAGEQPVGLLVDILLIRREKCVRSTPDRLRSFTLDVVQGH